MKMAIAVPTHADAVPALLPLLSSAGEQGFDCTRLLWLSGEKKPTLAGDCRLVRIHPEFVVEAAMHAALDCEWVFILHPGERFQSGPSETLRDILSRPEHEKTGYVSFGGEIRGFHRGREIYNNYVDLGSMLVKQTLLEYYAEAGDVAAAEITRQRLAVEKPQPITFPKATLDFTVVLPTWRLGGLDVTLDALAEQTVLHAFLPSFEVIIVDALHRWRAGAIEERLHRYPFPITHLPPDNDVFPLSSHSRFRNTAIRRACGKRLMFLSDYACPAPDLLERHSTLPDDTIGFSTWVRTAIPPDITACPLNLSVWDVVETAKRGEYLWSTFKAGVDPLKACIKHEIDNRISPPLFPTDLSADVKLGVEHYLGHWKADSAPTEMVRAINGWDEEYDGRGDQSDSDFGLRLLWHGAKIRLVNTLARVLDAHDISVAPLSDTSRDNRTRFLDVQASRMYRCVHGLTSGIIND